MGGREGLIDTAVKTAETGNTAVYFPSLNERFLSAVYNIFLSFLFSATLVCADFMMSKV
jgi:hypothetical protein